MFLSKCEVCDGRKSKFIKDQEASGDQFIPEMHLRKHEFTNSACGPFTKKKERIQKLKKTKQEISVIFFKTN